MRPSARIPAPALLLLAIAAFGGVLHNGFVSFDDNVYLTENPVIRRGLTLSGARWALTTTHAANWHPLTWLSHMLDVQLFGLNAGAHHLVNVAWHVANAVVLFLVLYRMTGAPGRWEEPDAHDMNVEERAQAVALN